MPVFLIFEHTQKKDVIISDVDFERSLDAFFFQKIMAMDQVFTLSEQPTILLGQSYA